MFAAIAPRYDLMNRLMTGGRDQAWRRRAARLAAPAPGSLVLDLATGTGDLARAFLQVTGVRGVVGVDFVEGMVHRGRDKLARQGERRVRFLAGDALALPFRAGTFGCVASAFLLRNLADLPAGLREMRRVAAPGGTVVALEITAPTLPVWREAFRLYFHRLVPAVGALVAGDRGAYTYLPRSVDRFVSPGGLARLMAEAGLADVRVTRAGLGTLVVLGGASATGRTIFAKNSDRPLGEAQPLLLEPRRAHPPGATVRCQYLEIPQAPETLAVLGSRPFWLWGFEHGVNERRVAIGNEALHTREEPAETGFLGMDLIRLGLERGRTAREARDVITGLLQAHGQGGSAAYGGSRRYHNSLIIADPGEAWVLETSGRHWAARRVRDRAAISNLATIGDDWDEVSPGIEAYATERGWWKPAPGRRFDFRAAFENPEPRYRAEARYEASCRFLARPRPPGVADLMRHLRDHYDGGTVHRPGRKDGDPQGWSVCMHPEPATGHTAASMVVELHPEPGPLVAWCSMTPPCGSVFLPVTFEAPLPVALATAGPEPGPDSAWWLLRALEDEIQEAPERRTPVAQAAWQAWERELLAEVARDPGAAARRLPERVATLLERRQHLLDQLTRMGG